MWGAQTKAGSVSTIKVGLGYRLFFRLNSKSDRFSVSVGEITKIFCYFQLL